MARKYRGERRNEARANKIKFPWGGQRVPTVEAPPVRANKRDRSPEAWERRARHVTMDFTDGVAGISRALINRAIRTVYPGKPKRGRAAAIRRAPFHEYFADDPIKLEQARMRHPWYRKKKKRDELRALLAAE